MYIIQIPLFLPSTHSRHKPIDSLQPPGGAVVIIYEYILFR